MESGPVTADLVEFLRARLDEDEKRARSTPGPSWEQRQITADSDPTVVFEDYVAVADPDRNEVVLSDVSAEVLPFVLVHDPARVLAEVEAKRETIRLYEGATDFIAMMKSHGREATHYAVAAESYLNVIRRDAAVYAGHDDYREEWKP